MSIPSIEQRMSALEKIEAIKSLKHRYLRACDAKDANMFRACFIERGAIMDYGRLGKYEDADPVVEIFRKVALRKESGSYVVLDMHHAFHPEIKLTDDDHAEGKWTLAFRQLDMTARTETVSSMEYEDKYVVEAGEWKISYCRAVPLWSMTRPLGESVEVVQGWGLDT
ncbi:nuclear transport factor 2 family protein [Rhodococcus sp. H29-C3]|uniref:nuclear transport factor 2 family protein n=1 Tax=Rhodococcus sp. H29-C3 TaxID=3046307 RepID=UPI0024BB6652|nr:nuclear transport factor 2 family protein [Rhodococcus sp. H29-C3]MDJ0358902.1 nuclear transport factor 2 family protein [Rhodococcus sp. H29-C3]